MLIEGWRSLIKTTYWRDYDIILHNLSFSYKTVVLAEPQIMKKILSVYELQKSAISWQPPDFKASANH